VIDMEQTTLSGDEWEDGKYVLFGKGIDWQ
jgi:hypothetical protein